MNKTYDCQTLPGSSTRLAFSQLRLGPLIGTGTVGAVYAATLANGQPVAVKMLHRELSEDPLIRSRFRREMEILSRLNHPHIVRYYGGGDHDGQLFYAMEKMPYGNLRQLLDNQQRLHWQEVASIGRQLASALQHVHNQGIVHRDVKPSNIFLEASGTVKLGDFGIARDLQRGDLTVPGRTVGTHAYMAPEQIAGLDSVGPESDLYSLGCVLYEALVGRRPFEADDPRRLLEMHLHQPPPRLADQHVACPSRMQELIEQMLEKSAERRPFNARAVQAELLRLLDSSGADRSARGRSDVTGDSRLARFPSDDPGMTRLARRLAEVTRPRASWRTMAILAGVIAALIILGYLLS